MAAATQVYTVAYVATFLGEDPEMLEAIVSNDDNLSYGAIVSVYTGADEAITALTGDGIDELRDMLADAKRSQQNWHDFLEDFVSDPNIIARLKEKRPAVTIGPLSRKPARRRRRCAGGMGSAAPPVSA